MVHVYVQQEQLYIMVHVFSAILQDAIYVKLPMFAPPVLLYILSIAMCA